MSEATGRHHRVTACRICGSPSLEEFLSLGEMPLANAFIDQGRAAEPEERFPLAAVRCSVCGLVQLSVVVDPAVMFRHYLYASSASAPLHEHFARYAGDLERRGVQPGNLVVEVGSNDGVLLRPLRQRGIRAIGVEPAANLAQAANADGLETWNVFFGLSVARAIRKREGAASAIVANNVLAHIDDLQDVVAAIDALLDTDGIFVAEVPYLVDLLEHVEYDTIYHEHLSYFALAPLVRLFAAADMEMFDVTHLAIHGGSIRIFVGRRGVHPVSDAVAGALRRERDLGLDAGSAYMRFAERVRASRDALLAMLHQARREGRSLAALGATAKGNTLLNFCGIGPDLVPFVADTTPLKHGLLTPGMHLPVRPDTAIEREHPDLTLLLAWNYADAILERYATYVSRGGRFIHPIPLARVIP